MTDTLQQAYPPEIQQVLEARAAELARPHTAEDDGHDTLSLAIVRLGSERYGIDLNTIREIKPLEAVTPMPATPPFWLGLVNLRGDLVPLLELGRYLGQRIDAGSEKRDGQVVVVRGNDLTVGLRVDEVPEVRVVRLADIGPSLVEPVTDRPNVYTGLAPDLVAVLDIEALLSDTALVVQDEAN